MLTYIFFIFGLFNALGQGFDSRKVKSILKLPYGAAINMVVSCGIREEYGVWGDRMRVPFSEVYRKM